MVIAKGRTLPDGTYIYICSNCQGVGWHANISTCSYCYGLNYTTITSEMRHARGQRYYALLKAALSVSGKAIVDEAKALMKGKSGKLSFVDFGYLSIRFNLNYKATIEWLSETRTIPYGIYDKFSRVIHNGKKATVAVVMEEARKLYGHIEQWQPTPL